MTAVIAGCRWALLGTPAPDPVRRRVGVGVALLLSSAGSPSSAAPSRASRTRSDGRLAITRRRTRRSAIASGSCQARYGTLRDSLARAAQAMACVGAARGSSDEEIWALATSRSRSREGEVVGVIGRNGAGKSTLLQDPHADHRRRPPGGAELRGRVGSLLEVGTGFHPELTGRENIFLNGAILGMKRREIGGKFDEIVDFAGVEQFIDTPVKRYSSGMYVRLAFSVAAHLEPEILLVDEVLAVGDAEFQRRASAGWRTSAQSGRTVLFVSHNMQAVARLCDRAILLDGGQVVRDGAERGGRRALPPVGVSAPAPRGVLARLESAPGDDLVAAARGARRRRGRHGRRRGRCSPARRDRDRLHGPARAASRLPEDQGLDRQGDVAFNAIDTSTLERAAAAGRLRATAWIPGNLLNEGLTRSMSPSARWVRQSSSRMRPSGRRSPSTCKTRVSATHPVVSSPGNGPEPSGPLDWTVEHARRGEVCLALGMGRLRGRVARGRGWRLARERVVPVGERLERRR